LRDYDSTVILKIKKEGTNITTTPPTQKEGRRRMNILCSFWAVFLYVWGKNKMRTMMIMTMGLGGQKWMKKLLCRSSLISRITSLA
jgi:hypothetical protein